MNLDKARRMRERDGFCRQVDKYDGQIISVDGKCFAGVRITVAFSKKKERVALASCSLASVLIFAGFFHLQPRTIVRKVPSG